MKHNFDPKKLARCSWEFCDISLILGKSLNNTEERLGLNFAPFKICS